MFEGIPENHAETLKDNFQFKLLIRLDGSIGSQGFDDNHAIVLAKDVLNIDKGFESFGDLITYFKNNPHQLGVFKEFVDKNPVKISVLPDGTYELTDGNHRANILFHCGEETVRAIIKKL